MTFEKRFVAGQRPKARRSFTGNQIGDLINKQKRRTMREYRVRGRPDAHELIASRTFATVFFGLTLYQACTIFPSGPIRNALRMIPSYSRP